MRKSIIILALGLLASCGGQQLPEIQTPQGLVRIIPMADNAARIVMPGKNQQPLEDLFYVDQPSARIKYDVIKNGNTTIVRLPKLEIQYSPSKESFIFLDENGKPLTNTFLLANYEAEAQGVPTTACEAIINRDSSECLFGLGQFQDGYNNISGLRRRLTQVNTQISIPMMISSKGYGLLWNNMGLVDVNRRGNVVELSKTDDEGSTEMVNATSTSGNKQEQRQNNVFEAEIEVDETAEYSLLMDVGQKMARVHNLSIDGQTVIDVHNIWLPPTTSKIVRLEKGKHKISAQLTSNDKPVVEYGKTNGTVKHSVPVKQSDGSTITVDTLYNATYLHSPVSNGVDFTIFAGNADQVIASYRNLTGNCPALPDWCYGYIHCRERYVSSNDILENANEFRRRGIPIDMIVQDWQWWGNTGWNSMEFDSVNYPDPKLLVDSLHKMDIRLMLSVWSKIDKNSKLGKACDSLGFYIKNTDWIDFFDSTAAAYYWQNFSNRLLKPYGIDAYWQDATEPENDDLEGRLIGKDQIPGEFYRNVYPMKVVETVYNGIKAETGNQPVILTRSGNAGIQRWGAINWSGDVGNDYQTLKYQIISGLGMMAAGQPYWTYDAGGFFRPSDQYNNDDYQLRMLRWVQTAVWLPFMRVHGYMSQTEPWRYSDETCRIFTEAIKLRKELQPYILEQAKRIQTEGYTLMRPLVFDFAGDKEALKQETEYMFGPKYLVCPVTDNSGTIHIYLPENANGWTSYFTGEHYNGGQYIDLATSKEHIEVFERKF